MSRKVQTQSPKQRIARILKFYESRGQNRENVNSVYRSIITKCKLCGQSNGVHKMGCESRKITINL